MQAFWESKVAQWSVAVLTVLVGGLLTLQAKDPATWEANKQWLPIALAAFLRLETLAKKKPKTVQEAVEDVVSAKKIPPTAVLLLAAALGAQACAVTPTPTPVTPGTPTTEPTPTPGQTFEFCTTDALRQAGANLLGSIANAVATGNYIGALEALTVQFGAAEVKCGVELFINSTLRKASADKLAATQVARAHDWLSKQSP